MQLTERVLENEFVRLEPLEDRHRADLHAAANADRDLWRDYYLYSLADEHFAPFWDRLRQDRDAGSWLPFAVTAERRCIGISCYIGIEPSHRALEIGNTYYHPDHRGTALNPAVKHLMLSHAFAAGANRVQFRVDAVNARSCAAMDKLGARREGVYRQERITWTGRVRDTVIFSILRSEWPAVEAKLNARLEAFRAG